MSDKKHNKCLICSSANLADLPKYSETSLCKCQDCSLVFARNIPSAEELEKYYESENYNRTTYLSPITAKRYHELLDGFEKYRNTNKLLDIGTGAGLFAQIAVERGWEVFGTELTQEAVDDCSNKGIKMFKGQLDEAHFEDNMFDVITCIETIEHLNNPLMLVKEMHRITRPNGMVYITTPNFNAVLRYWLNSKYDIIEYPLHLTYYTKNTLKKLFEEHHFTTASLETTGISLTRYRTSRGKSNQEYVSETSDDEMLRYRIEKNGLLRFGKNALNGVLNLFKVGDNIKATFIKK